MFIHPLCMSIFVPSSLFIIKYLYLSTVVLFFYLLCQPTSHLWFCSSLTSSSTVLKGCFTQRHRVWLYGFQSLCKLPGKCLVSCLLIYWLVNICRIRNVCVCLCVCVNGVKETNRKWESTDSLLCIYLHCRKKQVFMWDRLPFFKDVLLSSDLLSDVH